MNDHAVALRPKQIQETDIEPLSAAEIVLLQGDLSILGASQRVEYYAKVCESVGLNPLTKPFDYINLNGKLTLYAKKDATDQLRSIHGISVDKLEREQTQDSYDVVAYGIDRTGRRDSSLGSVPITNLRGEALSNAKMKAETKAKRRLTLSLAGLGWLDETEVASVATAQTVIVDEQGQVHAPETAKPTLAEIVQEKLVPTPTEPPGDAPDPEAPAGTLSESEAVPDTAEALPEEPAAEEPAGEPGLSFPELQRIMREKHVLSAALTATAKRLFGDDVGLVKDLTDQQRFALWEATLDELAS